MNNNSEEILNEKINKRKIRIKKLQEQLSNEKKSLRVDEKNLESIKFNKVIEAINNSNLTAEQVVHLINQEKQREHVEGVNNNEKNY